jgi:hypothetical protein
MVSNIYYAQLLIGLIAPDLHLHASAAGLIMTPASPISTAAAG